MGGLISKSTTEIDTSKEDDEEEAGPEILEIMVGTEDTKDESSSLSEFVSCNKEVLHEKYIKIKELDLTNIPKPFCHESLLYYIRCRAKLVVHIKVRWTSEARRPEDTFSFLKGKKTPRCATGYAWVYCEEQFSTPCPNKSCHYGKTPHDVNHGVLIITNKHVIFDNDEAKETEIQFFYDESNDSKRERVSCYGICLRENLAENDYVSLKVYHHSDTLFQMINDTNAEIMKTWAIVPDDIKLALEKNAIVISHPHGASKRVTFGELIEKEIPQEDPKSKSQFRKVTKYTCVTCSGSSGAPVFCAFYWNNPFTHSSASFLKESRVSLGMSFSY